MHCMQIISRQFLLSFCKTFNLAALTLRVSLAKVHCWRKINPRLLRNIPIITNAVQYHSHCHNNCQEFRFATVWNINNFTSLSCLCHWSVALSLIQQIWNMPNSLTFLPNIYERIYKGENLENTLPSLQAITLNTEVSYGPEVNASELK